jgi:hypothetical protein
VTGAAAAAPQAWFDMWWDVARRCLSVYLSDTTQAWFDMWWDVARRCLSVYLSDTTQVWYDMWWDVVPHTDRHNRTFDAQWEPLLGPDLVRR